MTLSSTTTAAAAPLLDRAPAGRSRTLRAYWTEARYETVRMLRTPAFALPLLGLPALLYLLFAVVIAGAAVRRDLGLARFLFAAFSTFGVIGPGIFGFGAGLAVEREQGLLRLKRALPMPPAAFLLAKTAMAVLSAALILVSVLVPALAVGHVRLTVGQILLVSAIEILGAIPFCALGLAIGVLVSGRSAAGWVNLVYQPMLHLSGLFYPLPGALRAMAPVWPLFHLHQLVLGALGAPMSPGQAATHVAVLCAVTVACGLFARRRLARTG
jgi:ABC-2 type transport system permease protein